MDENKSWSLKIKELYREWERSKQRLECTEIAVQIWLEIIGRQKHLDFLPHAEEMILWFAKAEWGDKTIAKFNESEKSVVIANLPKNKSKKFSYQSQEK